MFRVFFFLLSFLISDAQASILTIDGKDYSLYSFYSRYPKKQWERADSLQKNRMYNDYLNRELSILEAKKMGLENDPEISVKIRNRSLQILVNESYESFVAKPLILESDLRLARKNAKRELFIYHILIAYKGAFIKNPPQRTLDEALILSQKIKSNFDGGTSFEALAEKYSDDPSVEKNEGSLGWVQWGQTVPNFQISAFNLGSGNISSPILTDFGYHLILVSDERPSDLQSMSEDAYEEYITNLSKNTIRDKLRSAALEYDINKIKEYGVFFNDRHIDLLLEGFHASEKKNSLTQAGASNASSLLESKKNMGVLAVYNDKGYGPKWFAERLHKIPSSRQPVFKSIDKIKLALKTIILQDIAVSEGLKKGVDKGFVFKHKRASMISDLLYDAYLKNLVNSINYPDERSIKKYYNKNILTYTTEDKIAIRDLRIKNKSIADSLLILINSGADFALLAQQFSSINPVEGGMVLPFTKKSHPFIYSLADSLAPGEVSSITLMPDKGYSIIKLLNKLPGAPADIGKVYNQIEDVLIKEAQDLKKQENVDLLLKKYSVILGDVLKF